MYDPSSSASGETERGRLFMTEREAWIAFSCFIPIGPARYKLIVSYFSSALKAWNASKNEFINIGFKEDLAQKFQEFKKSFDLDSYKQKMEKLGINALCLGDKGYPERLKTLEDSPYLLYAKKDPGWDMSLNELAEVSVAVVGSRKMTSYGREMCQRIVTGLVDAGVTIISGLALGIDGAAHRTTIELNGKTVGILGGGLDQIYPPTNKQLGETIVKNRLGVLLSEYPLGYPAMPQNFPIRNRIVSGMALGVIIIEGAEKSGTLLTAALAASQGRDVFAVPGPVTSSTSWAPHYLIRNGAKLIESARDVLDELKIQSKILQSKSKSTLPESADEEMLLGAIPSEGADVDTIVRISSMETGRVLGTLMTLELKGMIKNVGGSYIKI